MATTDLAALLAAIDAGDDAALLPLADLLEEQGDARAAGLRLAGRQRPYGSTVGWEWVRESAIKADPTPRPWGVDDATFDRLAGGESFGSARAYPTRSAAYLALAAARA